MKKIMGARNFNFVFNFLQNGGRGSVENFALLDENFLTVKRFQQPEISGR